jgi:CNT family concentrative nucleoside transporter
LTLSREPGYTPNMDKAVSLLGLVFMLFLAWLLSSNRKRIDWKLVLMGTLLQFVFAVIILWTRPGIAFFQAAQGFVERIIRFSDAGAAMLFGEGFKEHFFAFSVLPTIIFISSLMAVFFYMGFMQKIVQGFAWIMIKIMRVSGAESLAASANILMGQTEAPLVIKPYVESMTRSELMALMCGGMANVAGGVLAAYVSFGIDAGHLLAASVMSAPASLVMAKIMIPEVERPLTMGKVQIDIPKTDANIIDAACRGAKEGLDLALNVAAMLIAFVALSAFLNYCISWVPSWDNNPVTIERVLGYLFAPIAWIMGVAREDALAVGMLIGKKTFLNEFIAYLDLKEIKDALSPRSATIATYALCGFANFSSIAIQIGGIGALIPSRRRDIASLGFRAMIAGTLSSFMTATIAGVLL